MSASTLVNMLNYHGSIWFGKMFLMDSSFFTFVAAMFIMGIDVHLQTANRSNRNLRLAGPYWNLPERIFE